MRCGFRVRHNVSVTEAVADLATEISPLPQTKIGKKDEQLTEKQQFRVTAVISWLSPENSPLPMNFLVKEERSSFRKLSNYLFQ